MSLRPKFARRRLIAAALAQRKRIAAGIPSPRPTFGVSPKGRWAELHARSRLPVADPFAEAAWVDRLADGLEGPCDCRRHWRAYLKAHPPTIDTPDDYEAWAVAAHNTVNSRLKRPTLTVEQSRAAQGLHVHNSAFGLGDAISGLYAACGLAKHTGLRVFYHARFDEWLNEVDHAGVEIVPLDRGAVGPDMNGGWDGYVASIANASTRGQGYCDHIAKVYGIAPFGPLRPAA